MTKHDNPKPRRSQGEKAKASDILSEAFACPSKLDDANRQDQPGSNSASNGSALQDDASGASQSARQTDWPQGSLQCDASPERGSDRKADRDRTDSEQKSSPKSENAQADKDSASMSNAELGRKGESAACKFLERKGFIILERNWVCAAGEADIIATVDTECGSELHFIEVKTRMSTATGFPEEAVNAAKRKRYEIISEMYMQQNYCDEARVTFDIISILVTSPDRAFLRMHCNVLSSDCF